MHAVPDDFRGLAMPHLARRIAGIDGTLDAAVIGRAAASLYQEPKAWRGWDSRERTVPYRSETAVAYAGSIRLAFLRKWEPCHFPASYLI